MNHLFLHCRPGFEKECAAEIQDVANHAGHYGYSKAVDGAAYVLFITHEPDGALKLIKQVNFLSLIFTRQWFVGSDMLSNLPVTDRVSALVDAAKLLPASADVMMETVDTNDGKALSGLSKKISSPLIQALKKNQCLKANAPFRLHVVFISGTQAWIGVAPIANSSHWPMGIPRLKLPAAAPSRATLKLEEAWHHFIPADEWDTRLALSMKAVDLGAAPGGWTWQLVKRGMFVEAVDNGPMDKRLMDSGQVKHILEDGFVYEPKKGVDWLVCDIVDKPARVTRLMIKWASNGYCKEAVFNLKLPMKQRYAEVKKCEERLLSELERLGISARLQFKQLYHDREEVTGHLRIVKG